MASVFAHLLETMPVRGVISAIYENVLSSIDEVGKPTSVAGRPISGADLAKNNSLARAKKSLAELPLSLMSGLKLLPAGKTLDLWGKVPVPSTGTKKPTRKARLWRWTYQTDVPSRLLDVRCRVRESGFKSQVALDQLAFGFSGADKKFHNHVEVDLEDGKTLKLPLKPEFVHSVWLCGAGQLSRSSSGLFPIDVAIEQGTVAALAYELDSKGALVPYVDAADPGEKALAELRSKKLADVQDNAGDRWIARAMQGTFMTSSYELANPSAAVGTTKVVGVAPQRFLVVLSIAACSERPTFEPVGVVGMARFFPHVLVRSNKKLAGARASVACVRPEKTTIEDEGDGTFKGTTCCNAKATIGSLLVADSNENPWGPNITFKPFWSGMFAYYETDPTRFKDTPLRVVDPAKGERTLDKVGTRDLDKSLETLSTIQKVARQGEFDNLHVAPRLSLPKTGTAYPSPVSPVVPELIPLDPSRVKLDDPVVMAPFCAHDCWHQHWRWGPDADAPWTQGFGSKATSATTYPFSAYSAVGAPMIPPHHSLDLTMISSSSYVLTEEAWVKHRPQKDGAIQPLEWTVFNHPGAAYAQGIDDYKTLSKVQLRLGMNHQIWFSNPGDPENPRTFENDSALFYLLMRYALRIEPLTQEEIVANNEQRGKDRSREFHRERIQMTQAELDRARKG